MGYYQSKAVKEKGNMDDWDRNGDDAFTWMIMYPGILLAASLVLCTAFLTAMPLTVDASILKQEVWSKQQPFSHI